MAKGIRCKRMKKFRAFERMLRGKNELARWMAMFEKIAEDEKQDPAASSHSNITENASSEADPPVIDLEKEASPVVVDVENEADPAVIDVEKENVESEVIEPSQYPRWLSHFKAKKFAKMEHKFKHKKAKRLIKELKKSRKHHKKIGKDKKKGKGGKVVMVLLLK